VTARTGGLLLTNRRAAPLAAVPLLDAGGFVAALARSVGEGRRIVSLFGLPETAETLRLIAVLGNDANGQLLVIGALVSHQMPSLSSGCPQAAPFEREISEQCGLQFEGLGRLKPVRRHAPDHAPAGWPLPPDDRRWFPYSPVSGEEVHEVAVGPVHAGIIEPGHFRLQAHGEEVLSLDIMLGYQHRGVERLLRTLDRARGMLVAESIAGDSVIAHASTWCGAIEALARCHKSPRAQALRGIALELERLANHIGDLGAMAGDVAYQPAAAYFGRLRGECLNLLMLISGNRYGRGLIRPGGVGFDVPPTMADEISRRIGRLRDELPPVAALLFEAPSVQSRFEGVGVVSSDWCHVHGFVGPVARSASVARDVRHDYPYGVFRFVQIPVASAWAGDVFARALVRWLEIQRSLAFVAEQVRALPRGELRAECGALMPGEIVVALEEGWRGEVVHVVITDDRGGIRRHKVTDPSFHNWGAVALAMRGNQISDFPLCNKSFNLSYAGHDL
jgi:Ni,Fe-hydrogenase III large subunit